MPIQKPVIAACLCALYLFLCAVMPATAQQRIASLNLCTDLLLLELVDRERIVSLTYWAADPDVSYLAGQVEGIPLNRSLVEEIVPLDPDLVLAGQFSDSRVVALLRQLGYRVEVLDVPLTLAGMQHHIRTFGALVGEPGRAEALLRDIEAGLRRSLADVDSADQPLAAVYSPQGVSPGRDTLLDDLLHLAGYRNLAAELGIASYGTLALEDLVRSQPDVLVLDNVAGNTDSIAHRVLSHPALLGPFSDKPVVTLPPRWSVCVGPTVVPAVAALVAGRPR